METLIELHESIPVRGRYDVVVVGGGVAGVAAAVSAKRQGCDRVLLVEKTNLLGGLATIGIINLFVPLCNGRGKQIIFGMAEELLRLSARHGFDTIPEVWKNGEPAEPTDIRYVQRFSPQIFALELTRWVVESGVELLFDCVGTRPVMDGTHCRGVVTESKSGREFTEAGVVVDATGDADLLFRAGVPTIQGGNYQTYFAYGADLESCRKAVEAGSIQNLYRFFTAGGADLYGHKQPVGGRLYRGTDVDDVSDYLRTFQMRMLEVIAPDDRNSREIFMLPTMPQLRTTRRIDGDYTLSTDDVFCHFDDSVGAICDFEHRDFLYEVPYRTMVRRGWDNLITVGRSTSGEGYAWDLLRVIPPAIATGEVSGIAASLALSSGRPIAEIEIAELQRRIVKAGLMLHFDDALVPKNREGVGSQVAGFNHI